MLMCVHLTRSEAVTLNKDILSRWSLTQKLPMLIQQVEVGNHEVAHLNISPITGDVIVVVGSNPVCSVQFRDWENFQVKDELIIKETEIGLTGIGFSKDGRWMAIADYRLMVFECSTKTLIDEFNPEGDWVTVCIFDASSTKLSIFSTGQSGGYISMFQMKEQHFVPDIRRFDRSSIAWPNDMDMADTNAILAFSADGKSLATYISSEWRVDAPGNASELIMYDLQTNNILWQVEIHEQIDEKYINTNSRYNILFTPNNRHIICGGSDGRFWIYSVIGGDLVYHLITDFTTPISSLALQNDHSRLWFIANDTLHSVAFDELFAEEYL